MVFKKSSFIGVILTVIILVFSFTPIYAESILTPTSTSEITPTNTPTSTPEATPIPADSSEPAENLFIKPTFPTFPPLPTLPSITIPKIEVGKNNSAVSIISPTDQGFVNRTEPLEVHVRFNTSNLEIKREEAEKKLYMSKIKAIELLLDGKPVEVKELKPAQKEGEAKFNVSFNDLPENAEKVQLQALIYEFYIPPKPPFLKPVNKPVSESSLVTVNFINVNATWNPNEISETLFPGTQQSLTVDLTVNNDIKNVSLIIDPQINAYFSIGTSGLTEVAANQTYTLSTLAIVAAGTSPGSYTGNVSLAVNGNKISNSLKVVIKVIAPSSEIMPDTTTLPSPERIVKDEGGQKLIKDEIIVMLNFDTPNPNSRIKEIASSTGAVILGSVPETLTYQLQYMVATLDELEAKRVLLEGLPNVDATSHHYLATPLAGYPNDAEYVSSPWDEANPAGDNWNFEYIKAPSAWDITTGDSSISVGVVDLDMDKDHGDLKDNVVSHNGTNTHLFDLFAGHGTHVAGTICARGNNEKGVVGMSWRCSLRLYDYGGGLFGSLFDGDGSALRAQESMRKAVDDGVRIVNLSSQWIDNNKCGTAGTNETLKKVDENNAVLQRAILYAERQKKDVLWVFAAGNECRDAKYSSPASLVKNFPLNTMSVASIDKSGSLSSFSDFGNLITVAAPGGDIYSTLPRSCPLFIFCSDKYGKLSGTSMAAPHVSGLAALVLAKHSDFTATQVKQCIVSAAQTHGASVPGHTFKTINAVEAVKCEGTVELPTKVDMVFSLDLTGSMGSEIDRVKSEVSTIITNLRTTVSPTTDFRFGVVSYEDYPGVFDSTSCGSTYNASYGSPDSKPDGDKPFRIDQALTDDADATKAKISTLAIGSGDDGPQSYGRVFWELGQNDTGATLGWRDDALKLVVNFGDDVPHDSDLNKSIDSPPFSPFDTGIDPGRNNKVDCGGDDIDFQDNALQALAAKKIHLLQIHSGITNYAPYWQNWVSVTDGAFAQINSDGSIPGGLNLTDLIISLLKLIPK